MNIYFKQLESKFTNYNIFLDEIDYFMHKIETKSQFPSKNDEKLCIVDINVISENVQYKEKFMVNLKKKM